MYMAPGVRVRSMTCTPVSGCAPMLRGARACCGVCMCVARCAHVLSHVTARPGSAAVPGSPVSPHTRSCGCKRPRLGARVPPSTHGCPHTPVGRVLTLRCGGGWQLQGAGAGDTDRDTDGDTQVAPLPRRPHPQPPRFGTGETEAGALPLRGAGARVPWGPLLPLCIMACWPVQ